jgi:hypothetical protein
MRAKLKKIWDMLTKEKSTRLNHIDDSVFYKRICVSKYEDQMEVYDTSTEIYRPLSQNEIDKLLEVGPTNFSKMLKMKSLLEKYHDQRAYFHREAVKGNIKKRDYHYNKALKIIKQLREFSGEDLIDD